MICIKFRKRNKIKPKNSKHAIIRKDIDNINQNVNEQLCANCGGECCQTCGCHFSPDDFPKISFKTLKDEIKKGYISIEHISYGSKDRGTYILRMRNVGKPIVDVNYEKTPCVYWNASTGCKWDYEHRPTGAKLLIPAYDYFGEIGYCRNCHAMYTMRDCCREWKEYQWILYWLMRYFRNKDYPVQYDK